MWGVSKKMLCVLNSFIIPSLSLARSCVVVFFLFTPDPEIFVAAGVAVVFPRATFIRPVTSSNPFPPLEE